MEFAIIAFTRRMGLFCQTNKQNPGIITVKKKRKESKDLHTIVFLLMVVQILKGTSIVAGWWCLCRGICCWSYFCKCFILCIIRRWKRVCHDAIECRWKVCNGFWRVESRRTSRCMRQRRQVQRCRVSHSCSKEEIFCVQRCSPRWQIHLSGTSRMGKVWWTFYFRWFLVPWKLWTLWWYVSSICKRDSKKCFDR